MRRLCIVAATCLLVLGLVSPPALGGGEASGGHHGVTRLHHRAHAAFRAVGAPTAAGRSIMSRGYLVRDPAAFGRAKQAGASGTAGTDSSLTTQTSPGVIQGWEGANTTTVSPGQAVGAVGPTRYVQLVNGEFATYDRSGSPRPSGSGTLATLTGVSNGVLSDPQILWDPSTDRFYFVVLDCSEACGGSDPSNYLLFGYSKTDSPNSAGDWCNYKLDYSYGTNVPDYPRLGDTKDFLLIGVNVGAGSQNYIQSDVDWLTKPASGATCQASGSFTTGKATNLQAQSGVNAFTPVPAVQTDPSSTGYVVAPDFDISTNIGDRLAVFTVTKSGSAPSFSAPGLVPVTAFSIPANAPQEGSSYQLDTMDARLTNAASGVDPGNGGITAIWTQHTVSGGAGAEVRWYEINPANVAAGPVQEGSATGSTTYAFNGGISNDRAVVFGGSAAFGDSMAMTFDTSSTTQDTTIRMIAKAGSEDQSKWTTVESSAGANEDPQCAAQGFCPWTAAAGASPDPGAPQGGLHGDVWLTNQWNVPSEDTSTYDWRTWVWEASPEPPTATITAPTSMFQTDTSFAVDWQGDQGQAPYVFNVRYRDAAWNQTDLGSYVGWKSGVTSTGDSFDGALGYTYCFSAQAVDNGGAASAYSAEECTTVPLDDRSFTTHKSWGKKSSTNYYQGTYLSSTSDGAYVTLDGVHAMHVDILVTKCSGCGSLAIYWKGDRKKTVSLSGSYQRKVLIRVLTFSAVRTGEVKLKVTTSGKNVYVDGLGVSKV